MTKSSGTARHHFDESWAAALRVAETVSESGVDSVLVRDIVGRATLIVRDEETAFDAEPVMQRLEVECAPFVGSPSVLLASEMFEASAFLDAMDPFVRHDRDEETRRGRLSVLERGVVGKDWGSVEPQPRPNHVALYGFKGGVGRSTAAVLLARHLAGEGRCVLLVDLDLESPGISAVALGSDETPDYGLVDLLVESVFGLDDSGLRCVTKSSRLISENNGEVWVAPASGRPRNGYTYIPKLNRAYLDSWESGTGADESGWPSFSKRLRSAIDYCVAEVASESREPDVVLLDSRAGIHDVAAVTMTKLTDLVLLFAADNAQTWNGYREVFQQWSGDPKLSGVMRERLRMVASMVPATRRDEYLRAFRDRAQSVFGEVLYDDAAAGDADAYNPPLEDQEAPHAPIPILFTADLVGHDISASADWMDQEFVQAAYSEFLQRTADLILPAEEGR